MKNLIAVLIVLTFLFLSNFAFAAKIQKHGLHSAIETGDSIMVVMNEDKEDEDKDDGEDDDEDDKK